MPVPVHIDCDTGQDDAIALLFGLGSKNIDIRSISVVGGNVDVLQCARNTLQILELAGREDIPVYLGAERPLKRELESLPEVFGITGMAGAENWAAPQTTAVPLDNNLASLIEGKVLVATAPLTNIAKMIEGSPGTVEKIGHLIIMGGCVYPEPVHNRYGNFKPKDCLEYAEYNFACDPEATKIVFSSGIKNISLIGVDVTRTVLYNNKVEKDLLKIGNKSGIAAAQILSSVGTEDEEDYSSLKEFPKDPVRAMHDVVAMAYVDSPEIFEYEMLPIRISDEPIPKTAGQTLIDKDYADHSAVKVITSINRQMFFQKLISNIANLG